MRLPGPYSARPPIELMRCRRCASPLVQPIAITGALRGKSIVARRCPECEHRDVVVAYERAVELWLRREAGLRRVLGEAANVLAEDARDENQAV